MAEHLALEQALRDAAEIHLDKGCFTRWLLIWMASAISSLPVPLSPVISTEALVRAMRATVFSTSISLRSLPIIWLRFNAVVCSSGTSFGAAVSSRAVSMRCKRAALFQGLVMKSNAPACIPCTGKLDTSPCRHQNNGHIGTEHLYLLQ